MVDTVNDLSVYKADYANWFIRAKSTLEEGRFGDAISDYPSIKHDMAPWTPYTGELSKKRVALFSTAGLYIHPTQAPFDAENIEGDWTHRELPLNMDTAALKIAHTHYNHQSALADLNSVFPLALLKEMQKAGEIGALTETHYSISGYCLLADRVAETTARAVVGKMRAEAVDVALFVPV